MKLVSLKLKGNIRLAQSGIDYFEWNPSADIQILLGTNGCGKSTVMGESSPLPAKPSDYEKGGYKIAVFEDKQTTYVFSSLFEGKPEHLFEVNGVNINTGKTITVQSTICRDNTIRIKRRNRKPCWYRAYITYTLVNKITTNFSIN